MFRTLTSGLSRERRADIQRWAAAVRDGVGVPPMDAGSLDLLEEHGSPDSVYCHACLAGDLSDSPRSRPQKEKPSSRAVVRERSVAAGGTLDSTVAAADSKRDSPPAAVVRERPKKSPWALATPRKGLLVSPRSPTSRGSGSSGSASGGAGASCSGNGGQ